MFLERTQPSPTNIAPQTSMSNLHLGTVAMRFLVMTLAVATIVSHHSHRPVVPEEVPHDANQVGS